MDDILKLRTKQTSLVCKTHSIFMPGKQVRILRQKARSFLQCLEYTPLHTVWSMAIFKISITSCYTLACFIRSLRMSSISHHKIALRVQSMLESKNYNSALLPFLFCVGMTLFVYQQIYKPLTLETFLSRKRI